MIRLIAFLGWWLPLCCLQGQTIQMDWPAWTSQPLLQGASLSMHVVHLESDAEVLAFDKTRKLVPASIQKLIPTGLMLRAFSPDHTFETRLMPAPGSLIRRDTLYGDLWLIGGGDPSLASARMVGVKPQAILQDELVQGFAKQGIKVVVGKVVGMARVFPDARIPGGYAVMDAGNYYSAPSAGLSWHDNSYTLVLRSGRAGDRVAVVGTVPVLPGLTHLSYVAAQGSTDNAYIYGMPGMYARQVVGTIPPEKTAFRIKGAVPDPLLFAAQQVQSLLVDGGIAFTAKAHAGTYGNSPAYSSIEPWWTMTSPAVSHLLRHTLEKSDNLFAETWVRWLYPAAVDPWAALQAGFKEVTERPFRGHIADGSGLSRSNAMSAQDYTDFLQGMFHSDHFQAYLQVLAKAGHSGTMRLVQLPAGFAGTLYGKSGYMTGVRSYAGYYQSPAGDWYAFALIANNYTGTGGAMRQAFTEVMAAFDQLP